ncbi:acyl-CoA dehydrogenase family protein [Streptomyces sp. NPDC047072]|uniref:acyl-CoA dehydrogenase family protein n=1 Tax=Streptomyces sp. NPDC047072 TaxID=3154809 RepID=UPI0033D87227
MDVTFTPEQDEIRRTLREVLGERCGASEVRAAVDTADGYDSGLWTVLAGDLGLPGLAIPTTYGGVGCSTTELALACEETGRTLAPTPLVATAALAAPLVLALGTEEQRARLLPRMASGELTATLAVPPGVALGLTCTNAGDWSGGGRSGGVQAKPLRGAGNCATSPHEPAAKWSLYGQIDQVLDGHSANVLIVAAHTGGFARSRTLLFLVDGEASGLTRTRLTSLDATRPQARLQLRDVPAELLGSDDKDILTALTRTGDGLATVLSCEAVGAADNALERTVEYVKQREQFGRAIGSFQAVKHRLADVYVQLQAARSAAYYAAWATAHDERVGGLALAQALEALRTAAAEGIQLHGGIGFTWEHEAHLYFKRAAGDDLLFGPVHRLRAHAAETARLFENAEVTV